LTKKLLHQIIIKMHLSETPYICKILKEDKICD